MKKSRKETMKTRIMTVLMTMLIVFAFAATAAAQGMDTAAEPEHWAGDEDGDEKEYVAVLLGRCAEEPETVSSETDTEAQEKTLTELSEETAAEAVVQTAAESADLSDERENIIYWSSELERMGEKWLEAYAEYAEKLDAFLTAETAAEISEAYAAFADAEVSLYERTLSWYDAECMVTCAHEIYEFAAEDAGADMEADISEYYSYEYALYMSVAESESPLAALRDAAKEYADLASTEEDLTGLSEAYEELILAAEETIDTVSVIAEITIPECSEAYQVLIS